MPGENLTRVEAQERASVIAVESYDISIDLTRGAEVFRTVSTVHFTATEGTDSFIDAITRTVHSVNLNGVELDVAEVSDGIRIALPGLAAENVLVVDADHAYTNTGQGLHRFVDPVDGEVYLYSQFEVPDSRQVYAVFEQPDLKAAFTFHVTAPKEWKVVSNELTPEKVELGADSAIWNFPTTPRISSYITALVAGPYQEWNSELTSSDGRTIPLGVFARASLAEFMDADYVFDKTREGFAFFESKFDVPYPFSKYDQLFVPEYNMGAMENAGAVTFTETYVFRSKVTDAIKERRVVTILHELAHMWFGDLVTMRWWNDLWLNESFAEWASTIATAEATEWTEAWTTFASMEKAWAYRQDQLPSTHPIVAQINDLDDVLVNFDGITYAKGGSVLKQLAAWVGIEEFYAGVSAYFKKHAFGNTELSDLLVELEKASGRDLTEWASLWLETAGVNTLRPELTVAEDGTIESFAVVQTAAEDYPTIRPHRLAIGFYNLVDGAVVRQNRVELDIEGERTEIGELVGRVRPDLILLNDDDLAYAKIRLDEASLEFATEHLGAIESPLARALVWGSFWDATRDAETRARDYVALVLEHIDAETESTTIRTTLNQLLTAVQGYAAGDIRDDLQVEAATELWRLAREAEHGSDAQFQFVKFFAAIADAPEHLSIIADLRSGDQSLHGLDIDTDLDWELLTALTAGGVAGDAEVDEALANDNTAGGAKAAALARAAQPDADAKRRAWDSVVKDSSPANAIVSWTTLGFQRARDLDVIDAFRSEFFEQIVPLWEDRSYHIAETLISGLYPDWVITEAVRDDARAWLAANADQPAALRRIVTESLAGTERALAARERDARD